LIDEPDDFGAAMKTLPLFFAAVGAASLLAVSAAGAFTFENKASDDSAVNALAPGVKPYGDPADRLEPSKDSAGFDSGTSYRQGGTSLQFGRERSFNEKYNSNDLFDPLRR
jgi:hypothetical protein